MSIGVRICHHDSQGMRNDAVILKQAMEKKYSNIDVQIVEYPESSLYKQGNQLTEVTHQFFLEHINPSLVSSAKYNIYIPNPEWLSSNDLRIAESTLISKIIAKTKSGYELLKLKFGSKVHFWGWTSIDRLDETVWKTFDECLHIKGCSAFKNSQMVLDTWLQHPEWPMLHVVSYGNLEQNGFIEVKRTYVNIADNVRLYQRKLNDSELTTLMNRAGIHICPSQMEGFGHYINEAKSCGSYVITTNGNPMNELIHETHGELVDPQSFKTQALSKRYFLDSKTLETVIDRTLKVPQTDLVSMAKKARESYLLDKNIFEENVII